MFFLISKVLSFLIEPGVWLIALLIYAGYGKRELIRKRILKGTILLLLVFTNPFLFYQAMQLWELPAIPSKGMLVYDVGIVLGTVARYDTSLARTQFGQGSDRLFQALELYKKGKIKHILYSGGSGSLLHPNEKDGLCVKEFLLTTGIPEKDIFIENESHNTHENAALTKPILALASPGGRYLLVTSAYHMRRSLACFKKLGIPVDPYCVDRTVSHPGFDLNDMLIPDMSVLNGWHVLFHELTGYVSYKIVGYI
jgi:uncharacterized SAM-binding protein YcdF (DUF218 family)